MIFPSSTPQLFILMLFLWASAHQIKGSQEDDFAIAKQGITQYFKTGRMPSKLIEIAPKLQLNHFFRTDKNDNLDSNLVCDLCNLVAGAVVEAWKSGTSKEALISEILGFCTVANVEDTRVCQGAININVDIFLYIIDHKDNAASRFCDSVLQSFGCKSGDDFEWSIKVPGGNSKGRLLNQELSEEPFNILQLSDIHYDPYYKIGGNAACEEPICCQQDQGESSSAETSCGYWSDYRSADVPWHLVVETVNQTKKHDFDYVYYTGDIISHRVWDTSVQTNKNDLERIYGYLRDNYDVPVYPVFGNHEPHPLNVWSSEGVEDENLNVRWLLELAVDQWSAWLGDEVKETLLKGGYYSVSPRPGFRVVGLNGNICYTVNWWLVYDDIDPFGQLQWLVEVLTAAEENNESVHILSHVPTGSASCLRVWSREYRRIVERFANTITGQFNGHTHSDEFHVYYNSSEPLQPVSVAFNGASVTPFSDNNPSYKIYQIEPESFTVLDYQEWTFNLTLANSLPPSISPQWYSLYSFREAYGVENLQPHNVGDVLYKMSQNHALLDLYNRYKYRDSDVAGRSCSESCRLDNLCDIAISQYGDNTQCDYFRQLYTQHKK